ncbi:type III secretion system needle filament subunit SctF [Enterobacter asburiae]|uniref:type III secretion system needle filament subunit SctF n=1 Tax=Enterobacter asburiae TaxID=61645 RepID=UPI0020032AA5|nr:type III secretion system needle filament subunit SctF [Enterobacter asburiae]MCK7227231.1 type III secretion system needle filament subunit SctF [Enterobacter asburiae]
MNIENIVGQVQQLAGSSWSNIQGSINPMALNSPGRMLEIQQWTQQYSTYVNFESAMIKTVKDMLAGIIQKI